MKLTERKLRSIIREELISEVIKPKDRIERHIVGSRLESVSRGAGNTFILRFEEGQKIYVNIESINSDGSSSGDAGSWVY